MVTKKFHLRNTTEALQLFGQQDEHLRGIEERFGVQIFGRGEVLSIRGAPRKVEQALETLHTMRDRLVTPASRPVQLYPLPVEGEEGKVKGGTAAASHPSREGSGDVVYTTITGKAIRPQTPHQHQYVKAIQTHDMVIAIGPAGTGKTFLAVACGLAALKTGRVTRIVLTRPVVEAGEKLGFLPGDFYEKVNPYLKPLYDAFYGMLGPERFRLWRDEETVEIVPLAYMRGRTLDDAFIILDEAQNTTPEQMKMFLTRLGIGSQTVITGDITQIDLEDKRLSGLVQLPDILMGIPDITFVRFAEEDVVRHGLVKQIIRAYEAWEKQQG
ncbi:MAG: PhoH family protein [Elusimicrobia bacterium]|nr:PhoH family protein [Elusimicrobiota bacterium]